MSTIRSLLLLVASLTVARPALAQGAGQQDAPPVPAAAEVDALEAELDTQLAQLSTADCALACKALESMARSAERICGLAPGERCQAARDKVDSATRKVRSACPDCASSTQQFRNETKPNATPAPVMKGEADDDDNDEMEAQQPMGDAAPASAPPQEDASSAGCASCSVGEHGDDGSVALSLLLALGLVLMRRRRRDR